MDISKNGLDLIKSFEGCRLTSYQDDAGVWTIAWGRTSGVKEGQTCTQAQADAWLLADVEKFAAQVRTLVHVPVNQNEFDALVSFHYNTGALASSDLLKYVNEKKMVAAANEFPKWCHITIHGKKVVEPGLVRRRAAEKALFVKPVESTAPLYYTVVAGDNLAKIAAKEHTTIAALEKLNHFGNPNVLAIGQKIRIK